MALSAHLPHDHSVGDTGTDQPLRHVLRDGRVQRRHLGATAARNRTWNSADPGDVGTGRSADLWAAAAWRGMPGKPMAEARTPVPVLLRATAALGLHPFRAMTA